MRVPRHLVLAVALLCTAPASAATMSDQPAAPATEVRAHPGGQPPVDRPAPPAEEAGPPAADEQAEQAPPDRYAPVESSRVAIRVEELADPKATVERARRIDGVAHATAVRIARSRTGAGPDAPPLTVAAVDPVAYRPFAPQVVADEVAVWERLDDGEIAVTHEHAERLGLDLGGPVVLGGAHGIELRVGALATVGIPPIAEAMVDRATGARLGLDQVPATLLVALDEDAESGSVAAAIEDELDVDATIVPDPRARTTTGARPPRGDTVWDRLAQCESSGNWHVNTGNGYYGGLQFLPESWRLVGGTGMPHEATREEQIHRAELLLERQGWIAWPVCSVVIGVREPS